MHTTEKLYFVTVFVVVAVVVVVATAPAALASATVPPANCPCYYCCRRAWDFFH